MFLTIFITMISYYFIRRLKLPPKIQKYLHRSSASNHFCDPRASYPSAKLQLQS